jgi:hypothetical protein
LVDEMGGTSIADLESPLQERRRTLLGLYDDLGGLAE